MDLIDEKIKLSHLEKAIDAGLKAFKDAGLALAQIRDSHLYRVEFSSFEDYCRDRWKLSRGHAYRLIEAAEVVQSLEMSPIGTPIPINEAQARPLAPLDPPQRVEAMVAAAALASAPTASQITRAAAAVKAKPQAFQTGVMARVLDEGSPHYGKEVQVKSSQGVIVEAIAASGETIPFLSNELAAEGAAPSADKGWARQKKEDHFQAVESELQVAQARIELLEAKLKEAIDLIQPLRARCAVQRWIAEVDRLVF